MRFRRRMLERRTHRESRRQNRIGVELVNLIGNEIFNIELHLFGFEDRQLDFDKLDKFEQKQLVFFC